MTNAHPDLPVRMLHDRILVSTEGESGERRSGGGIVIPATVAMGRRLAWARVVAVGPGVRTVQIADRVLFDPDDRAGSRCGARTTSCSASGICTPSRPSGWRTEKPDCICEAPFAEPVQCVSPL